jgi:hypothetical protein
MPSLEQFGLGVFAVTLAGAAVAAVRWRRAPRAQRPLFRASALLATGPAVMIGGSVFKQQTGMSWPGSAIFVVGLALVSRGSREYKRALEGGTPPERADG